MMMQGLVAGGMTAVYDHHRDLHLSQKFSSQASGFNPGGVYELSQHQLCDPDFPASCDGCVIKLTWQSLHYAKKVDGLTYRVMMMYRHPEEVRQSYEATISYGKHTTIDKHYDRHFEQHCEQLERRGDVEDLQIVNHRQCIYDPLHIFRWLCCRGWPIDPEKAATVVNPHLYRFRIENLIVGA